MGSAPALSELAPTCKTRSLFWQSTRLHSRVFTTTPEPTLLPFVMTQLSCAASQLELWKFEDRPRYKKCGAF